MCVMYRSLHGTFYDESIVEIIVKIGPHLPQLLSNIKWLIILRRSVFMSTKVTTVGYSK